MVLEVALVLLEVVLVVLEVVLVVLEVKHVLRQGNFRFDTMPRTTQKEKSPHWARSVYPGDLEAP